MLYCDGFYDMYAKIGSFTASSRVALTWRMSKRYAAKLSDRACCGLCWMPCTTDHCTLALQVSLGLITNVNDRVSCKFGDNRQEASYRYSCTPHH